MHKQYYGYYESPIGWIEVICSQDAVVSVKFTAAEKKMAETNWIMEKTLLQLDEYFKGTRKAFDLEFLLEGTRFQKQVWQQLGEIPYGTTLSYKELAAKTGNEKAMRAVGSTNGKNPLWIILPCHRVIGSNGALTGYAGGLYRKKWLLEHEANNS